MSSKSNRSKQRARARQARTDAPFTAARSGNAHEHPVGEPDPAVVFPLLGWADLDADLGPARALVGAARAVCNPCQDALTAKVLAGPPTVIAMLAGAVYGMSAEPMFTSQATADFAAALHHPEGRDMLAYVDALDEGDRADLLEDTLDLWFSTGRPDAVADFLENNVFVHRPEELDGGRLHDLGHDQDGIHTYVVEIDDPPTFAIMPGVIHLDGPGEVPALTLVPEAGSGHAAFLDEASLGWTGVQNIGRFDVDWRVRVDIATRSMRSIAHVDANGYDDHTVWKAAEIFSLPDGLWNLLDRVQHALIIGPVPEGADVSALLSSGAARTVVGRVSFS